MYAPTTQRGRLGLVLALALAATTVPGSTRAAPAGCAEATVPSSSAAALKPAEVLLGISAPRAGETLVAALPSGSVSVAVDYWGPTLMNAKAAQGMDNYHLVYILDEDAAPYIGTLQGMPNCDPQIRHSTATRITFDNVAHGSHALTVLLAGSNDVSVNPPVAARVTFTVR